MATQTKTADQDLPGPAKLELDGVDKAEAPHAIARALAASIWKKLPQPAQIAAVVEWLRVAELQRECALKAVRNVKARYRRTPSQEEDDVRAELLMEYDITIEIAVQVAMRAVGKSSWEELTPSELRDAARAARDALDAAMDAAKQPGMPRSAVILLARAIAAESAWNLFRGVRARMIHGYGIVLSEGKFNACARIAALALVELEHSNADIARALDMDLAQVRRITRGARVS